LPAFLRLLVRNSKEELENATKPQPAVFVFVIMCVFV
jgi:hypothetical protein